MRMKVRYKKAKESVYEVVDTGTNYYVVRINHNYAPFPIPKSECEIVDEWRDVTAECSVLPDPNGQRLWHDANHDKCVADLAYGYKFVKVRVQQDGGVVVRSGNDFGPQRIILDAFIIERREP
jgi:hypothetical protein